MLKELMEVYHKEISPESSSWDKHCALEKAIETFFPYARHAMVSRITAVDKLALMRDFIEDKEPSLDEAKFIASLGIEEYNTGRVFRQKEAKDVMLAYEKCAEMLLNSADIKEERKALSQNIETFISNHIETRSTALDIYDRYLFDVPGCAYSISRCIKNQPKLLEKGFAVMHKAADARCKQAEIEDKKLPNGLGYDPKYAASGDLRSAFKVLFDYFSKPKLEHYWDTIAENLLTFDKQMERFQFSNILLFGYGERNSELIDAKRNVLYGVLEEAEKNKDKSLREIYQKRKNVGYQAEWFLNAKEHSAIVAKELNELPKTKKIDLSDIDFVYTGKERPSQQNFDFIQNYSRYSSKGSNNPSKASGGLWASPVMDNGKTDWENWLSEQGWGSFMDKKKGLPRWHIVPKEGCRILYVGEKDDDKENAVRKYILNRRGQVCTNEELKKMLGEFYGTDTEFGREEYVVRLDYTAMEREYDAIYVPTREDSWSPIFFGWDVKSMHIFNLRNFDIMDDQEYEQYKVKRLEESVEKASTGDKLAYKKAGKIDFNQSFMRALKDRKIKG